MYGIIYKATNKINNKVYIGQTTRPLDERIYYHTYRAYNEPEIEHTHFINAIRKYGANNFVWEIIDEAESKEELNSKEIYWIKQYNSIEKGYNIQYGGTSFDSEKFAQACGSKPFYVYKVNGEFVGEFINKKKFCRDHNIADTHVKNVLEGKYNSYCGYIFIDKEDFAEEKLKERLSKAKQSFRPFIAIKLDSNEQFGPFESMKECRQALKLTSNHISEILKGIRKSQEGYTFKFIDILENNNAE